MPRTGTLWDSRYNSSLVRADTYLLKYQYISSSTQCVPAWLSIRPIAAPMAG